jgi:hypothetical protein
VEILTAEIWLRMKNLAASETTLGSLPDLVKQHHRQTRTAIAIQAAKSSKPTGNFVTPVAARLVVGNEPAAMRQLRCGKQKVPVGPIKLENDNDPRDLG